MADQGFQGILDFKAFESEPLFHFNEKILKSTTLYEQEHQHRRDNLDSFLYKMGEKRNSLVIYSKIMPNNY